MVQQELQQNVQIAKKVSRWVSNKWQTLSMMELLTQMIILAEKHSVSYMQIWAKEDDIAMKVFDAFDIYLDGTLSGISEQPFIIKAAPKSIEEIKYSPLFKEEFTAKLSPDNKYATSEIKEAYMVGRYGNQRASDAQATVLLKESFIKEYLCDENRAQVKSDLGESYEEYKDGDTCIRHIFSAAGITLSDTYEDIPDYPFVEYRLEPGPMYQVPLIERFIPANKSLDSVMSRIERHIGTMAVGAWLRRRGENWQVNNLSGGQVIDYEETPPVQAQVSNLPSELFNFIGQLNSFIEEQGASTSALGNVPSGVKSGVAIESLKATEYANLKIASDQLKLTVQRIAEKMLDIADKYYTEPTPVLDMERGKPEYFDVIGQKSMEKYKKLASKKGSNVKVPEAVPLSDEYNVKIEIESGLGFTQEGKRQNMVSIIEWMTQLAQLGMIPPEGIQKVVERFLEIFQFGNISEFMEAMQTGNTPINEKQIQDMKIGLLEVIKDLQTSVGGQPQAQQPQTPPNEEEDILKIKTGVVEAMRDLQRGGSNATD